MATARQMAHPWERDRVEVLPAKVSAITKDWLPCRRCELLSPPSQRICDMCRAEFGKP